MAWLDNLVAHWKLDEESGTRVDEHSTNDLSDNNTVQFTTGVLGNAARLEAANGEYLDCADNAEISCGTDTPWTIAMWVRPTVAIGSTVLCAKTNSFATQRRSCYMVGTASGYLFARVGDNVTYGDAVWGSTLPVDEWHLIIGYHDPVNDVVGISVDGGTPVETAYAEGTFDSSYPLLVGALNATTNRFTGDIDSLSLWFRVLTSEERTALYASGAGLDYPFTGAATVHSVTGDCVAVSEAAGTPTVIRTVTGAAAAVSTAAGVVTVIRTASGACAAVSAAAGVVTLIRSVTGDCSAVSTVSGDAQIVPAGVHSVTGSCASVSAAAGTVTLVRTVSGSCAATSTASGDAQLIGAGVHYVTGNCLAVSAASGLVTVIRTVTGNCAGVFTGSGIAQLIDAIDAEPAQVVSSGYRSNTLRAGARATTLSVTGRRVLISTP